MLSVLCDVMYVMCVMCDVYVCDVYDVCCMHCV